MSKRRLTQLELGNALGIAHTSVGRWLNGSVPHKRTVAQVAAYFDVSVDDLLDDSRDLPIKTEMLAEAGIEYHVATTPIKTAAALAQREHGDTPAGQTAFEKHLANLRSMRAEAERIHPGDPVAAAQLMDTLIASYLTAQIE